MPRRKTPQPDPPENAADVTEIVKTKRKPGPDPLKYGCDLAEPGDNSRYLRLALTSWNLPKIDISDPKQVEQRITEYFNHCADNDRKPNVVGMANWLGISRATLNTWKRGEYRSETHLDIIEKAMSIIEEQWVDYMMNGKVNPASGIFIGKNHMQYSDTQQIVLTPNNPMQGVDSDQASQRMLESMPDDT